MALYARSFFPKPGALTDDEMAKMTYANLPPEAKQQCDDWSAGKFGTTNEAGEFIPIRMSKEDYLEQYYFVHAYEKNPGKQIGPVINKK